MEKRLVLIGVLIILIFVLGTVKYSFSTNAVYKVSDFGARSLNYNSGIQKIPIEPTQEAYSTAAKKSFNAQLLKEIDNTEKFLKRNKKGLYTPDPRNITPIQEYIRLNIVTQAHGYLNLYKMTGKKEYLREAEDRLNYIISVGNSAYRYTAFDGMMGYTFLSVYEADHNQTYLNYGMGIANMCISYPDLLLNWGFMCSMAMTKAYKLTNNSVYLTKVQGVTSNTTQKQFTDGGFPHVRGENYSISYTSWMMYELQQIRKDIPNDPVADTILLQGINFLDGKVQSDGNYYLIDRADQGWTSDAASLAYNFNAMGKDDKARKMLEILYKSQFGGTNKGAYPDKWDNVEPINSTWSSKNPSVLRTSLIFWYLTSIPLRDGSCINGALQTCPAYTNGFPNILNQYNVTYTSLNSAQTCVNGKYTSCMLNQKIPIFNGYILSGNTYFEECDFTDTQCDTYDPFCKVTCSSSGFRDCIEGTGFCKPGCPEPSCVTECSPYFCEL